jgi:hypothetical protein
MIRPLNCETNLEGTKHLRPAVQRGRNARQPVIVVVATFDQALAGRNLGTQAGTLRPVSIEHGIGTITSIFRNRCELSIRFSQAW